MNKTFFASVISLFMLISLAGTHARAGENIFPEHKVNINLSDSKIQWTGTKN